MKYKINHLSFHDLKHFLESFAMLQRREKSIKPDKEVSYASLQAFFENFSDCLKSCTGPKPDMNIFEICKLGRDEIRNCSVLAWLLDRHGSHGLGDAFLHAVLEKCGLSSIAAKTPATTYGTRTEYCPNGDQTNRVDIACDGSDFLIYFEVKIDSLEHTHQTQRYQTRLKSNVGKREGALIFISPRTLPASKDACYLSWQDCAQILDKIAGSNMEFANLASTLRQYAEFVRKF